MDFQQHLQAQPVRFGHQFGAGSLREAGGNQQHSIGTRRPRIGQLAGIDNEVLAEDGDVYQRPNTPDKVQRTAEIGFVREDAERGGSTAFS